MIVAIEFQELCEKIPEINNIKFNKVNPETCVMFFTALEKYASENNLEFIQVYTGFYAPEIAVFRQLNKS